MNDILAQLGGLVLGSIPTLVLFLLLIAGYATLVHGPLRRTLAERRERTAGAVEKAHAAIAQADAKAREYEERLRAARVEIGTRRDKQVAEWNGARDRAAGEAREAAQARVREARAELEQQTEAARGQISSGADALADEVLRSILPAGARG